MLPIRWWLIESWNCHLALVRIERDELFADGEALAIGGERLLAPAGVALQIAERDVAVGEVELQAGIAGVARRSTPP